MANDVYCDITFKSEKKKDLEAFKKVLYQFAGNKNGTKKAGYYLFDFNEEGFFKHYDLEKEEDSRYYIESVEVFEDSVIFHTYNKWNPYTDDFWHLRDCLWDNTETSTIYISSLSAIDNDSPFNVMFYSDGEECWRYALAFYDESFGCYVTPSTIIDEDDNSLGVDSYYYTLEEALRIANEYTEYEPIIFECPDEEELFGENIYYDLEGNEIDDPRY